ncbi:uncharacterized protein LOC144928780 [Branchiostoma floridae x Branchiostoma belcheri]
MSDNPRQDLFLKISRNLVDDELRDLRNYVSGAEILAAGFVQSANGHQIFTQLEKEGKLKPGDLSLLANLLRKIGRHDFAARAEKVAENERKALNEPNISAKRPRKEDADIAVGKSPRTELTSLQSEDGGGHGRARSSTQTHGTSAENVFHTYVLDAFESLKHLLTEVKIADDSRTDTYNRLSRHVAESGLTFRAEVPKDGNCLFHAVADQLFRTEGRRTSHVDLRRRAVNYLRKNPYNVRGDHLRAFVPDQNWDRYLDTMSRDGTWGDHIVLQAMADMFGHDVSIVSSVEAENYVTILTPSPGTAARKEPPLLLGHYAENHYASLDAKSSGQMNLTSTQHMETQRKQGKHAVLLICDEYGTAKGGVSTMNCQAASVLRAEDVKVYNTVLYNKDKHNKDKDRAIAEDGVILLFPKLHEGDDREPSLRWLTYDHLSRYPSLPDDIGYVIGHVDITSKAARKLKEERLELQHAKFLLFGHVIPEDTEHYKSDERAMGIGDKSKAIQDDMEHADVIFSVGPVIFDYYQNQLRSSTPHHIFLPKPSDIFKNTKMTYVETETKVVLSIGRVKGVERLKGYDLVAIAMNDVIQRFRRAKWRIKGILRDAFQQSKRIIDANIRSGSFHFTALEYGTQEDLCRDIRQAHVVIMASRAEPFGLVGLEALAAGVPVIISDRSGLAEFIKKDLDPEFDRNIVEMEGDDEQDAKRLAKKIIKIFENGQREHDAAQRLKDKLWKSEYWKKSHKQFLQACGVDGCSNSRAEDAGGASADGIHQKQPSTVSYENRGQRSRKRSATSVISSDLEEPRKRRKQPPAAGAKQADVSRYFDKVVRGASANWDDLARKLKFEENEIDEILELKRGNNSRCREMLKRWRNRKGKAGKAATLQTLKKALTKIGHTLTAESLEDLSDSSESSDD